MKLKAEYKKAIIGDFRYAAKKMMEVQPPDQKLFYFTSTFGTLSRIFNFEFSSELVFAYSVLSSAHATVLSRIGALKAGDITVSLQGDFFERLAHEVEELAKLIEKNEDIHLPLEKITLLAYITTGNGFYLLQRGMLSL